MPKTSLSFLGAAGTVTGSKHLLRAGGKQILVDCGLFQGVKELRLRNWAPPPLNPKSLDAVVLTHAHLDHVGYLPLLVREGFKGPVYATAPTRALAKILLLDAARIQEEDAETARTGGYSHHATPQPLFTQQDAERATERIRVLDLETWQTLGDGIRFRFLASHHILGSAFVEIECARRRICFSGDLGREKPILFAPPIKIAEADYLVLESTYGDRRHSREPVLRALTRVLRETYERGGDVLIPCFAVGRSQEMLHLFAQLARQKQLPPVPVYFDSPMGIAATRVLGDFPSWHRLGEREIREMSEVAIPVRDARQSLALAKSRKQKIVLAGSGMLTGGRSLNYLPRLLPKKENLVLFAGFQAAGTRGRLLQDGAPEIKVRGEFVAARARVEELSGLSAHADQFEILSWLRGFRRPPTRVFLVHGEPQACDALRVKIEDALGWDVVVPKDGESISLDAG